MVNLTTEQRVLVVRKHYETGSYIEVQEAFRGRFPDRDPPVKATRWKNVTKYERSGTSLNLNKGNSGRRRTATSVQNVDVVRVLLENNPNINARRNDSGLSRASFNRITKHIYAGIHILSKFDMHSKKTIFAGAFTFPAGLSNSVVIYSFCPTL